MAVLPIIVLGAPILRQATVPVTEVTGALRKLAEDMKDTMRAASGVGLAAPQVGHPKRLCVVEVDDVAHVLFNPEIVAREGKLKWEEGCLSIPEVFGWVDRSGWVKVRALDKHGEVIEVEGSDLLAVCLQHEIDHLDGKLFIDHLSFLKRRQALAAWEDEKDQYPGFLRILKPGGTETRKSSHAAEDQL